MVTAGLKNLKKNSPNPRRTWRRFQGFEKREDIKQFVFVLAVNGTRTVYTNSRINSRMRKDELYRLPNSVMSRRTIFYHFHHLIVVTRALVTHQKLSDLTAENQSLRSSLEQNTLVLNDRTSRCVPWSLRFT